MPQKVVNVPGIGPVNFPDNMPDDDIRLVIEQQLLPQKSTGGKMFDVVRALAPVVVDPAGMAPSGAKKTLIDLSIGAAKGAGRNAIDLSTMYHPNRRGESGMIPDLQAQNAPETMGGVAVDAALAAASGGASGASSSAARNFAVRQWQKAAGRPILESPAIAEDVLKSGLGRLTRDNAAQYAASHPTLPEKARATIETSVKGAERYAPSRSVIGLITQPGNRAALAQGVYNAATPAVQAVAGGGGTMVLRELMRLLSGGDK